MSLIDEALKRAQAADQEASTPRPPRPWTPPPLPDRRPWRSRQLARWLGRALIVAALAGAGILVSTRGRRARLEGKRVSSAASLPAPPPPPSASVQPSQADAPGSPREAGGAVKVEAGSLRSRTQRERAGADVEMPAGYGAPGSSAPPAHDGQAAEAPPASPARKVYRGEAPAPGGGKIELGGIVYSEENPVALLNGRVLAPGGFVEGLTVARIEPDRVELRGNGGSTIITIVLK